MGNKRFRIYPTEQHHRRRSECWSTLHHYMQQKKVTFENWSKVPMDNLWRQLHKCFGSEHAYDRYVKRRFTGNCVIGDSVFCWSVPFCVLRKNDIELDVKKKNKILCRRIIKKRVNIECCNILSIWKFWMLGLWQATILSCIESCRVKPCVYDLKIIIYYIDQCIFCVPYTYSTVACRWLRSVRFRSMLRAW